jgi:hypothetical protein
MNHPVLVLLRRSDRADLLGPRALGTAADGELDPLVFLKAAVTASLDGGMVGSRPQLSRQHANRSSPT